MTDNRQTDNRPTDSRQTGDHPTGTALKNTPMQLPDLDALPAELREAVAQRGNIHVYRMVTHSPGLAPSFLTMATDMFMANSLPPVWRELVILRVGHRYEAPYEIHHHVNIARAVGLGDAAIAAAGSGDLDAVEPAEKLLIELANALLDRHTLTDDERDAARTILDVDQLAALVLTVGFYQLVSNFLNTFGVTIEQF
ncbi:carboxymuconolactone decarboxylase family protein [Gordonia desulfuricans]|nr:carboxymuconolactone decarboxylase family protein [Gordonia desulfuricans]